MQKPGMIIKTGLFNRSKAVPTMGYYTSGWAQKKFGPIS